MSHVIAYSVTDAAVAEVSKRLLGLATQLTRAAAVLA